MYIYIGRERKTKRDRQTGRLTESIEILKIVIEIR